MLGIITQLKLVKYYQGHVKSQIKVRLLFLELPAASLDADEW